jgi:hypothetical protein
MSKGRAILNQIPTLLLDVVVPYACFQLLKKLGLSDSAALCWTAIFPGVKVAFDLLRSRKLDIVACVVIWEICLTLALNALFHNARLILLKGPVQVAALGLACIASLPLKSPLAQFLARMFTHKALHVGGEEIQDLKEAHPDRFRTVTLAWGLVSIADAIVRTILIFTLSTATYLIVSRLVQTVYFTGLGLWTFRYIRRGLPVADGVAVQNVD